MYISNCPLQISFNHKLSHIIDIFYKSRFLAEPKNTFNSATFLPSNQLYFYLRSGITMPTTDASIETQLDSNVRVYKNRKTVKEITQLVAKYAFI